MTKPELVAFLSKELAVAEGGWQSMELRVVKATHSAELLAERLIAEGHVKVDDEKA